MNARDLIHLAERIYLITMPTTGHGSDRYRIHDEETFVEQLARSASRLPPEKRERFLALPPEMQRQLVARQIEKIRARRAMRQQQTESVAPEPASSEPVAPAPTEPIDPAE